VGTFYDATTNKTWAARKPTKLVGNPLLPTGTNGDTWDREKNGVSLAIEHGGLKKMWVFAYNETASAACTTYQYSNDGITWTKPNLGLISYDGDTNNNIVSLNQIIGIDWDAANNRFVGCACLWGGNTGVFIVASTDGVENWTLLKTLVLQNSGAAADYAEGNAIVILDDGTAIVGAISGHENPGMARQVYTWKSETSNLSGSWGEKTLAIPTNGIGDQCYTIGFHKPGNGLILGSVVRYNQDSGSGQFEYLPRAELWISRDGIAWTLLDDSWFTIGANGTWDDRVIFYFNGMITLGGNDTVYYSGGGENHATFPRDARIGAVETVGGILYETIPTFITPTLTQVGTNSRPSRRGVD